MDGIYAAVIHKHFHNSTSIRAYAAYTTDSISDSLYAYICFSGESFRKCVILDIKVTHSLNVLFINVYLISIKFDIHTER